MRSHELIAESMSEWKTVRHAPDLAHQMFERLSDAEIVRLATAAFADEIRKALTRKDSHGVPVYANIDVINPGTGKKEKRYKQTAAFDADDWKASFDSYLARGRASFAVANALAKACKRATGVQLTTDDITPSSIADWA